MTVTDTAPTAPGGDAPGGTASGGDALPGRLTPRLQVVLVILLAAQFMLAVNFSILNVALPVIGEGLGFDLANLQWITTSFALCAAGFTLLFGRIADLFGRRRLFLGGLVVLGAASLLGGVAISPELLIVARVFQGLATAAVTPAGLSLLTTSFPEGPLREKALGLNGALMSAGFTTGAVLGGVLTDLLSWRYQCVRRAARARGGGRGDQGVAARRAPEAGPAGRGERDPGPAGRRPRPHPGRGARLGLADGPALPCRGRTAAACLLRRRAQGRGPARTARGAGTADGGLGQHRRSDRLLDRDVTRLPHDALYLQKVLGFSPLAAGLSFGVLGIGTAVGGTVAPRVIGRVGTRSTLIVGGTVQTVATAALIGLGDDRSWMWLLLTGTFVGGVGNMLVIVGFMVTATTRLPDREQGLATGLATMTQQIGITMGTPVMSAVATAAVTGAGAAGILGGLKVAIAVNAAIVLAGTLAAALFLRRAAPASG